MKAQASAVRRAKNGLKQRESQLLASLDEAKEELFIAFDEKTRGLQAAFQEENDEEMREKDELHGEEVAALMQALLEKD